MRGLKSILSENYTRGSSVHAVALPNIYIYMDICFIATLMAFLAFSDVVYEIVVEPV